MRIVIKLASIYCLCILCCGCREEAPQIDEVVYVINVDSAEKRDVFYLSSIVKSVRPILLEETDYALIGEFDKIQIFDNNIFLLDSFISKKLYMYDMNGKFVRQIGTMGERQDEYRGILDFCIDAEKKEIHLYEYWSRKLLTYRISDGKHMQTRFLSRNISYSNISYNEGYIYSSIKYDNPDERNCMLVKIDLKTGKHTEYLDIEKYCGEDVESVKSTSPECSPKYGEYYTNTILECKNDSVYTHVFVKSKDWVQKSDIYKTEENDKYLKKKGLAFGINRYIETDSCIYFRYHGGSDEYQIVYSKQTGATYLYRSVMNDVDFNPKKERNKGYYSFWTVNSKYTYSITPSNVVSLWLEQGGLSPELEEQVKQIKLEEEGYVVFEYELK